jgi:hypothetical protein
MKMTPFKVTCHVATPMQLGSHPLHLDGLLYWLAIEHQADAQDVLDVCLDQQAGIYKASALCFAPQPLEIVTTRAASHPTCWKWNEFSLPTSAKTIVQKGGPYRSRMTSYTAYQCSQVVFFGVGDMTKIQALLSTCNGLGRNSNQGWGEITAIEIEPMDQDCSWFMDDQIMRTLPLDLIPSNTDTSHALQGLASIAPPYTTTAKQATQSPVFLKV